MTASFDEIFGDFCNSMMEAEMLNVALVYGNICANEIEYADEESHPVDFKSNFAHCGRFEAVYMRESPEVKNTFEFVFFPEDHSKPIIIEEVIKPTVH